MENFTPYSALAGGLLIGLSAAMLLLLNGRLAGISGILGRLVKPAGDGGTPWRLAFAVGLLAGPLLHQALAPRPIEITIDASLPVLIVAGLLVGVGTRLGGGCTSGHGVCGIGRFSARSIAATAIFMAAAGVTVFVANHAVGG